MDLLTEAPRKAVCVLDSCAQNLYTGPVFTMPLHFQVKGPFPKFDYKPNVKKEIGMIAGGTGEY